jgi:hypothetical protein
MRNESVFFLSSEFLLICGSEIQVIAHDNAHHALSTLWGGIDTSQPVMRCEEYHSFIVTSILECVGEV